MDRPHQQPVVIQGRQESDAVGVAGENCGHGRAEVVPHRCRPQRTDLADGVPSGRQAIHQAHAGPTGEQVGGGLRRRTKGLSNFSRAEGRPPFAGEPVEDLQSPIVCHGRLQFTLNVYQ
jgi:hypothetical protein